MNETKYESRRRLDFTEACGWGDRLISAMLLGGLLGCAYYIGRQDRMKEDFQNCVAQLKNPDVMEKYTDGRKAFQDLTGRLTGLSCQEIEKSYFGEDKPYRTAGMTEKR